MKFCTNKKNIITIVFLLLIIIISHIFLFFIGPFIITPADAVKPFSIQEEFTVKATLLNSDGTKKLDSQNKPQQFMIDIDEKDSSVNNAVKTQMNNYIKNNLKTAVPAIDMLRDVVTKLSNS